MLKRDRLVNPSPLLEKDEDRRQARLLASLLLIMLMLGFYTVFAPLVLYGRNGYSDDLEIVISVAMLATLAVAYRLSRTHHFRLAARLTVWLSTLGIFWTAVPGEATDAYMLVYLVLPVILSSIFLPVRHTACLIGVNAAGMLAFPLIFDEVSSDELWFAYVLMASIMILLGNWHLMQLERIRYSALQRSEAQNRALLDAIPDLMFQLQRDGTFSNYKGSMSGLWTPPELFLGHSIYDVLPELAEPMMELVERALSTGTVQHFQYQFPLNGQLRDYEARLVASGENEVVSLVRDVTERVQTEKALWSSEVQYRTLFEESPIALWEEDFSQVRIFIENLRAAGITDFRAYFEKHPEAVRHCADMVTINNVNQATLKMFGIANKADFFKNLGSVFSSAESRRMFGEELCALAEGNTHFEHENIQQKTSQEDLHLVVTLSIPPDYEATWSKVFLSVMDITERKRAEEELHRRDAILSALAYVSEHLLGFQNLDTVLPDVLAHLGQAIGISRASIFENHTAPDGTLLASLRYEWSAAGISPQIDDLQFQNVSYTASGFERWATLFRSGHTIHGAVDQMEGPVYRTLSAKDIRSFVAVPIFAGDVWWGFLGFDDCVRERDWLPTELEALRNVARTLGAAIDRRRSEAAEREQRALSDALRDTAAALNRTLDRDQVLVDVLANIERVVPHDAANIMLFDNDEVYIARAIGYESHGTHDWMETVRFPITDRPRLEKMVQSQQGYLVTDTHTDPDWLFREQTGWVRSHICVPICIENQVLGAINLDSGEPGTFSYDHLARLQTFADQAGVAIHNAWLYDELEQRVIERTSELMVRNAVAETLSSSLDMHEMLAGVLKTTVAQLDVLGGAVYLLSPDTASLEMITHYGVSSDTLDLVTGIGHDPRPGAIQGSPVSAVLNVPIWRQEQIQGVITLVHDQPRPWRREETRMIDAIGRQIGMALFNARLYAEAVRDEAHIRTILQSVADGLLVLDQHARPILMNPAAENLFTFYPYSAGGAQQAALYLWEWLEAHANDENIEFELPTEALVGGQPLNDMCREAGCPLQAPAHRYWPCWLQKHDRDAQERIAQCDLYHRIPRRAIQARCAAIHDAAGDVLGTVIALRDVTYYRELDTLKGRFVSTVSHELRTPLSVLLLQASTLRKYYDRLDANARREMVTEMEEQVQVLSELVEDILELSRFDAKRALPKKYWFDLAAQCREVIDIMTPVISEKGLTVDMSRCAMHCKILGDQRQLARVVRNLMSNAIKYTPPNGTITVGLRQRGTIIQFYVQDTGIGIDPEDQMYVYDRFFRAETAARTAPGTGLGLSITREIVNLHSGQIELASTPGRGSTFTVYLPAAGESLRASDIRVNQ